MQALVQPIQPVVPALKMPKQPQGAVFGPGIAFMGAALGVVSLILAQFIRLPSRVVPVGQH